MHVDIDKNSGFCWGVVRTVQIAEDQLQANLGEFERTSANSSEPQRTSAKSEQRNVYVLGNIIHNPREIERLEAKGLKTISVEDFPGIAHSGAKVIIRAHGEPPATYRAAFEQGIEIIDATCPVVTKLQERVRKFWDQGYQVVIFGKKDHAEVLGVRGVVRDECIVIKSVEEAEALVDLDKKTVLFSQTTMDRPTFIVIRDRLKSKVKELIVDTMEEIATEFHAKDTICGQVSGRENLLVRFAQEHDVILFVAGRTSSNGKVLYDVAKQANEHTHFIEDKNEIDPAWLQGAGSVGITGATSTPHWYMEEVKIQCENMRI